MTLPQITAQSSRFLELEKRLLEAQPTIEHWLRGQWTEHTAPFYASVDLRNSGFKLAPVDTNLFPGGFNNLNPEFLCFHIFMRLLCFLRFFWYHIEQAQ